MDERRERNWWLALCFAIVLVVAVVVKWVLGRGQ